MTDGTIAGRFRIRALLGSGGTAAVFAADDEQTGRRVALKLLHPHLASERAAWEAFFEEVRAAGSIGHPGLAEIFDAGVDEAEPPVVWIAMELVEGTTLADHVRAHGPLAPDAAAALADGLLAALAAAHDGGVVHRDVTPANVMFDPDALGAPPGGLDRDRFVRSIRLLDFGLADVPGRPTLGTDALLSGASGETAPGVVASVPYASPEQLTGEAVTEASDVYQAGATLYFALTGRPPFAGEASAVVRAHLSAPPPVPSARRRGVPRELDRIVTTAMLKTPADRYPDAAAMRAALLAAMVPAVVPPGRVERTGMVDGTAPIEPVPVEHTALTRVYRTALPPTGATATGRPVTATPPPGYESASRPRWAGWVAAGIGAIAIIGVVALSAAAGSSPPAVPSVPSTSAPVVESTPTPSDTPTTVPLVAVPELVGLSLGEAAALLAERGLVVGGVTRVDAASAADTVLAAEPGAGAQRAPGSPVDLRVASGNNAVPAVAGLTLVDATALLAAAGFGFEMRDGGPGTPGQVIAISPGAGEVVPLGSTIVLTVARQQMVAPSASPSPTTTPTPTPSGSATP